MIYITNAQLTLRQRFKHTFRTYAAEHKLEFGWSGVEPNASALFLPDVQPASASGHLHPEYKIPRSDRFASCYEFAHIHGGEGSVHLILAPLDASLLIDKGWAVRFPMAGGPGTWGYAQGRVLVYAPRDDKEMEVVMKFVQAGWEYLTAVPRD